MRKTVSVLLVVILTVSQMSQSESQKSVADIEKDVRKLFPEYEFNRVIRPGVKREGRVYEGKPYLLENMYRTSSRVCRVRTVPLIYRENEGVWSIDEGKMHSDLVYFAAVTDKVHRTCADLDFESDFFVTADPIADDALVKLYESFSDKATIRAESAMFMEEKGNGVSETELLSSLAGGTILRAGMNSFGLFQKTIDYEVTFGVRGGGAAFVFHVFYDDHMQIRKIEQVYVD